MMKIVYFRSKTWLAFIVSVAVFSTINVYFLSPYKEEVTDGAVGAVHGHEVVGRLDHHNVEWIKLPEEVREAEHNRRPTTSTSYFAGKDALKNARTLRAGPVCPNLTISLPVKDSQSFQHIAGTSTFVYSAYLVGDKVRIIVLRMNSDPRHFFCHIWVKNDNSTAGRMFVTKGSVQYIPEDHQRDYLASYILCDLPHRDTTEKPPPPSSSPFAVSVVLRNQCSSPSNRLVVIPPQPLQFNFTVCVTPLNKYFGNTRMFVEMIEFNKLLGADRFVFYNYSIHPDIGKILHFYRDRGEVDLLQWPSSASLPQQAHYFGQLASLNDCLYRYKTRSRFIVYQDLDEFLVPTGNHYNWSQLINARLIHNPKFALFMARCTFFRKEWPKPYERFSRNDQVKKYGSIVLGHTLREGKILNHGHRSKYIINPKLVETVGIHDTWSRSGSIDRLDPNQALLYHYRDWGFPNDTQKRVEDRLVVDKYGLPLINRLAKAWDLIRQHTGLIW